MKDATLRHNPAAIADPDYEGALQTFPADRFEDRVSEEIFDIEGERAELDVLFHRQDRASL
jgi:hypothetical protein